jgi:phage gp46-like protein
MDERYIDPETGGYVDAAGGKWRQVDGLRNKVIWSLKQPLGTWVGAPDRGHRLGELAGAGKSATTQQRLRDYVRQALQWLVDAGLLTRVEIDVEDVPGGYDWEARAYAPGQAEPIRVSDFVEVGV